MGIQLPADWRPPLGPIHVWPGYRAPFIRRPPDAGSGDAVVLPHEVLPGVFGLLPRWAKDEKLARSTYNARSETVTGKPSFREAWKRAQHCLIPAEAFYEPDWRSGKAVPTRISRADGEPMGLAGLWERWRNQAGEVVHSMTMLTVNADGHPFMQNFHRPTEEKRMVVILPEAQYEEWLDSTAERSMTFMARFPADRLVAEAEPKGR
jgi:putative SOS response-associated peptidase YedK